MSYAKSKMYEYASHKNMMKHSSITLILAWVDYAYLDSTN